MSEPEQTILLELRNSAKASRNDQYRETARTCADHLEMALNNLDHFPCESNAREVVGLWSLARRILDKLQPHDDAPGGGQVRVESTEKVRVAA